MEGKLLIFCNHKETCEQLAQILMAELSLPALTLHGAKSQY